ncbi:hypothetical protein BCE75_10235 [Isoptericola sp. CG 20/1183]|uniref:Uncharacterized protein n=2 Tax=Promicromonosporaceae TaxID=85017 RepID=A0ABX5ELU9_9MICO|nr:hypothetical protein BCE75_10235 [Isoptericola sp. CG 20/1183]PRZ10129.1 hypothetical protein BCL65_101267 [Isoptericola halotolerans]
MTATNITPSEITLMLTVTDASCGQAVGTPDLQPYSSGDVTFVMSCTAGEQPRPAEVSAQSEAGPLVPSSIAVIIGLAPVAEPQWSALWWYVWLGVPLSLVGVVPPYLFWLNRPRGNTRRVRTEERFQHTSDQPTGGLEPWWDPRYLKFSLPGITSDWSFQDNWASSVGLAAALFTTVFAGGDSLDAIVGDEAQATLGVVAVAAGLSTGIIGSGPLWLTIFKRRYDDQGGIAKHNTIGGVLVASIIVLLGTTGLLFTAAAAVALPLAWILAAIAALLLLVYAWKSIPQTLALGRFGGGVDQATSVSASL